jgi:hypothetical protein
MIRANTDALRAGNYRAYLWQSIETEDECSCVRKIAGDSSDTKCFTCYGTSKLGGYNREGFDTHFFSSSKTDDLTLDNVQKDLRLTPNRLRLKQNETFGVIESPKFRVENALVAPFEFRFDAFTHDSDNSSVVVLFAINDEVTWRLISELSALVMRYGELRFRIEIDRINTTIRSPQFEVFRFRYQNDRGALLRISRNMAARRKDRTTWGEVEAEAALRFWMGPKPLIRAFLEPLNADGRVIEDSSGQDHPQEGIDPFLEIQTGTRKGERYIITTVGRSEPLGRLISQKLTVRNLQADEIFYTVF